MKSISNKKIDGDFFNPGSSKAETASIVIEKSKVSIFKGEERLYHLLKVQSVQNEKSIFLENGILFVTKEKLNEIDLKLLIPKNEFLLQNLDKFKLKNVLIILLIIVILFIMEKCTDRFWVSQWVQIAHLFLQIFFFMYMNLNICYHL